MLERRSVLGWQCCGRLRHQRKIRGSCHTYGGVTIGILVPAGRNAASYPHVSTGIAPSPTSLKRNARPNGEAPVSHQRTLARPRRDGSTHLLLDPLERIEKLCALSPPPRVHPRRCHGVLAPHAAWRSQSVPRPLEAGDHHVAGELPSDRAVGGSGSPPPSRSSGLAWSALLNRVFAIDTLVGPRCGGPRRLVAVPTGGERLPAFLERLGRGDPSAARGRSRSPPGSMEGRYHPPRGTSSPRLPRAARCRRPPPPSLPLRPRPASPRQTPGFSVTTSPDQPRTSPDP